MPLHNIDISAAMRRIAERRIEAAMEEGKFANLEGAGKPLELEPMPADENARMTWWAIRLMRQNQFIPDEVRLRKSIDRLREHLASLTDEAKLAHVVTQLNLLVHKLNTLGTNAISHHVGGHIAPVDLETERQRLRRRLESPEAPPTSP